MISGNWTHGDWISLAVAIGTIALAFFAFWQIFGDARRRPYLNLEVDREDLHTRLEGQPPRMPWIRLLVSDRRGKRTAHGARVLVQWYRKTLYADDRVSLAGPELGWPSTSLREGDGSVIFGGMSRPVDFGALGAGPTGAGPWPFLQMMGATDQLGDGQMWWFRFTLAMHGRDLFIGREFLPPINGGYTARLTVGADEGRAREFDVKFDWVAQAPTPQVALDSFTVSVTHAEL